MDDQNQTNQPLVPGTTPVVPSVPEDITPVAPVVAPAMEPITPPTPWNSPAEPVSMPTPSMEPAPAPEEPVMPAGKPKKKILPIIGGVLALLLVVGVAGAAYYVSNQLSTRQAVAPTAPESKPMASTPACGTGLDCSHNNIPSGSFQCTHPNDPSYLWNCCPTGQVIVNNTCSNPSGGVCNSGYTNCDEPHCVANTCVKSCWDGADCFVETTGCTECGDGGEEPPTGSCDWHNRDCTTDSQCYTGYAAGDTCYDVKCSSAGKCVGADEMTCDPWYWGDCKVACGETSKKQFQPCHGGGETYTREGYGENGGADCTEDNACKELVCKVTDRDSPIAPKTITFPQAGTVRVFTWSMNGTLTLTPSGGTPVVMQSSYTQGNPAQLLATELEVTAGQTYTVKVQLTGEGGDAYGWIPVKPNNICGPVKKPANTTTAGCGENKDISSVINKTNEPANNIQSIVSTQCWGDKLQGDPTQDYDFNDFAIVFAYEKEEQEFTLVKKAYRNKTTNHPGTYDYSDEIVAGQTVSPDEVFVYRLNITTEPNAPTADILDILPPQLTFVDAVTHCTNNANSVVCNDVPLGAGDGDGWAAFRVKVKSGVADGTIIHNVGKLTVNGSTVEAVKDIPVDVPAGLIGACTELKIFKGAGDDSPRELTPDQLNNLVVGDVLRFQMLTDTDNLNGRFGVGAADANEIWLPGTIDAANRKLVKSAPYTVSTAAPYSFQAQASQTPGAQDWDITPPDACKATGIVSSAPVGACMSMSIYKKVEGKYLLTPMTDAELQNLKVGDLLKFSVAANLNGLRARFRVTIGGVPGVWLDGIVNPDLPKQFVYTDYQVGRAGPYVFEGEVSTVP